VAWVGDNQHLWKDEDRGIERAIRCILESSKLGYCVVGSDVAGYHGPTPIPPDIYIRWAQFSAFCGLFLNGGHGERALWKRTEKELEIVRTFSWLHTEIIPYIYSHVVRCHEGGLPLIRPVGDEYGYFFGDDFLVFPIFENVSSKVINLPEGRWRYLFDEAQVLRGPHTLARDFPDNEFPVYIRDGSVIPMNVSRPYTGFGTRKSDGFLTLAVYPFGERVFTVHHPDGTGTTTVAVRTVPRLSIGLTGTNKPHILRILCDKSPKTVRLDGRKLASGRDWRYDKQNHLLWITTSEYADGDYTIE
jgi:alpha-glucosidase (family GH31 glycosyl hydrolase)